MSLALPFDEATRAALLAALLPAALAVGARLEVRATSALGGVLALAVLVSAIVFAARVFATVDADVSPLVGIALPSVALALAAAVAARSDRCDSRLTDALSVASALVGLAWLSVEVRLALHGTTAEQWAHSVTWLVSGGVILVAGILCASRPLRMLSLAVVLLAVGKVFLLDTAHLDGLARVGALLGLGASLIALALLYQRLLFPSRPRSTHRRGDHP